MKWYLKVLKNYFGFKGRASRKEFWMFALFNTIFIAMLILVSQVVKIEIGGYPILFFVYLIAVLTPSLAVSARRLHDIGKSGWYLLIILIPFIGALSLSIVFCFKGVPGENGYGENPKGISDDMKEGIDYAKKAGIGWLVAGYIFSLLGGLIGILIGQYLKSKIMLKDSSKVYKFDESSRSHGSAINVISIILLIVNFLVYCYLLGSQG